jgi:hypothetical protein
MQVEIEDDVAQGVLEGRRVMGEHSDQPQAPEPVLLPDQETEMRTIGCLNAGVEQAASGGEGGGVLGVFQHTKIEICGGENGCGILAEISQQLRDASGSARTAPSVMAAACAVTFTGCDA